MILRRIFFSVLLLLLVIFAPYWLYLPVIALGIIILPFYLEGVVIAILVDVLYGSYYDVWFISVPTIGSVFAIMVLVVPVIKSYLRFHA